MLGDELEDEPEARLLWSVIKYNNELDRSLYFPMHNNEYSKNEKKQHILLLELEELLAVLALSNSSVVS